MNFFNLCRAWFKIIVSMKKCARSTLFHVAIAFLCVGRWFGSAIQAEGCWRLSPELGVLSSKYRPISGMSEPTIICTGNPAGENYKSCFSEIAFQSKCAPFLSQFSRHPTRSPHRKLAIPFKPPNWCEHQRQVGREAIIRITTGSLQGCYNSARFSSSNIAETIGRGSTTTTKNSLDNSLFPGGRGWRPRKCTRFWDIRSNICQINTSTSQFEIDTPATYWYLENHVE